MRDIYETLREVPSGVMVRTKGMYCIRVMDMAIGTAISNGKSGGWISIGLNKTGPFKALKK